MKQLYALLSSIVLLLPLVSKGQGCDNKVTVSIGGVGVRSTPNSTTGAFDYCPSTVSNSNSIVVSGYSSTPNSTLTWTARDAAGNTTTIPATSTTDKNGTYSSINVNPIVNTTYTVFSQSGCKPNDPATAASAVIAPSLEVSASSSLICSGTSTTLTATGSNSGQYTWSGNGIATTTTSGSLVVSPTETTTYTVTTNTASCGTSTQQITVNVKSLTVEPNAPAICAGQSISLVARYSGSSVTSYQWENVTTGAVLPSTTATLTVAPTSTSTYKVTATTTDCSVVTQQVTVSVQAPTINVSPDLTICSGTSTVLTASSNNPNTTYRWVDKASPATTLSSTASYTASLTTTTTYQVIATTCGISQTTDVTVTVANTATLQINPASPIVCAGNSATLTAVSNVSGATYKWYEGSTSTTVISTASVLTVAPAATTTYRVEVTTPCGSTTQNTTVTVTPAVAVTPVAATITKGSTVTLTASGSVNGVYTWTATANGKTTPITATSATITVSPVAATTVYTVTGTNTNSCTNTAQATVTMPGGVLPVELVSFTAKWNGKSVLLNWSTASEKNNAYFEIERSLDGVAFEIIEKRAGAGTTSGFTSYQFSDVSVAQLATSLVYYRLRQVDVNGEATYSAVQAVQVVGAGNAFKAGVFPNPYEHVLTLQFTTPQAGAVTVTLRNMLGQVVVTKAWNAGAGAQEISLPQADSLPSGVYYLTIRQGAQQQVVKVSHQ